MALSTVSRWLQRIELGKRSRLRATRASQSLRAHASRRAHPRRRQEARADRGRSGTGSRGSPRTQRRTAGDGPPNGGPAGSSSTSASMTPPASPTSRSCADEPRPDTPPASCVEPSRWFASLGITRRARDERQRLLLPLPRPRRRLPPSSVCSHLLHSALPATHQRQGRALHPDSQNRWAYGAIYGSSAERTTALPGWLTHYNFPRRHGSLGHKSARRSARRADSPGSYT